MYEFIHDTLYTLYATDTDVPIIICLNLQMFYGMQAILFTVGYNLFFFEGPKSRDRFR